MHGTVPHVLHVHGAVQVVSLPQVVSLTRQSVCHLLRAVMIDGSRRRWRSRDPAAAFTGLPRLPLICSTGAPTLSVFVMR